MPLKHGKSQAVISFNIEEMMKTKPSDAREKAIHTYMKNHDANYQEAKLKIAQAAAFANSRRGK